MVLIHIGFYILLVLSIKHSDLMQTIDFLNCGNETGIILSRGLISTESVFTILFSLSVLISFVLYIVQA